MNIREIAKLANVSVATVSRAMNRPEKVKPETLLKIRKVMQENNYTGNPFARNLINSRTKSITLLINSIDNQFMMDITQGAEKVLFEAGYMLSIINISKSMDKMANFMDFLQEKRPNIFMDGLILAGSYLHEKDYCSSIQSILQCPLVVIDKGPLENITTVYVEERSAMKQVASHFAESQVQNVAIIPGEMEFLFSKRRCDLLVEELKKKNITVLPENIFSFPMEDPESSRKAVLSMKNSMPQGIYAANEALAMGTLRALHELGLLVPDEVSVVAGENSKYNDVMIPSLSSISYPNIELGEMAAHELLLSIEDASKGSRNIELPTRFIKRES
ncbi:LacI family DNA-binding transcriptional regulator [Clostridia bacterium]|nr:LacI family DNA-binding transcriptional regulator [Clostridia bacterium]